MGMGSQVAENRIMSRIENDVETVKKMTGRVEKITEGIVTHARSLGYFEPPSDVKAHTQAPTPVVTTLSDALSALDRALDHCSGSLNVYD